MPTALPLMGIELTESNAPQHCHRLPGSFSPLRVSISAVLGYSKCSVSCQFGDGDKLSQAILQGSEISSVLKATTRVTPAPPGGPSRSSRLPHTDCTPRMPAQGSLIPHDPEQTGSPRKNRSEAKQAPPGVTGTCAIVDACGVPHRLL